MTWEAANNMNLESWSLFAAGTLLSLLSSHLAFGLCMTPTPSWQHAE